MRMKMLARRNYGEEELYEFAAQVLLGEKALSELDFLEEEDKAKVVTIVRRGRQALYKQEHRAPSPVKREVIRDLKSKDALHHSFRAIDQPYLDVSKLANCLSFPVFPLYCMKNESEIVQRKFMEAINRRLPPEELALLFSHFSREDCSSLFRAISPRLAEDIKGEIEDRRREWTDYDLNVVFARYSIAASAFLSSSKDLSSDMTLYAKEYKKELRENLSEYCKKLPEKFELIKILLDFQEEQWMRLLGLTPRIDMAFLAHVLPKPMFDKFLQNLPVEQREEVREFIAFHEREKKENLSIFADILNAMRRWVVAINKVMEK